MEIIDKKSYIEKIAYDLFLNVGYDATSIRRICNKAKIEPPTLYNFFGSKKGLFFSVAQKLQDLFMYQDESFYNLLRSLPSEMQLYSIFSTSVHFSIEYVKETKFFYRYTLFCPEELQEVVHGFLEELNQNKNKIIKSIINECIQAKLIGVDIEQASSYFFNFVNNHSFNVVFENWRPTKEELLEVWRLFFIHRLKGTVN